MLKSGQKLEKTENVVTYSTVQNIGLPGLLFRQLLAKKHIRGTKIPPSLEPEKAFIAAFKCFHCWQLYFVYKVAEWKMNWIYYFWG